MMSKIYGHCKDCMEWVYDGSSFEVIEKRNAKPLDNPEFYHKQCYEDKLKFHGFDDRVLLRCKVVVLGDAIYRRNSSDKWLKTVVNKTYLELIRDFPNDYKFKEEL